MHQHGGDIYTYHNCIDFSTNVNPLGMPKSVMIAAMESIVDAVHYPDPQCRELKAAICRRENAAHCCVSGQSDHRMTKGEVFCGNGAADVIFALAAALKPKRALLPVPSFSEYEQALRSVGCDLTYYYLKEENDFKLQLHLMEHISEDVDMVFLCNPNNPTGELIPQNLLIRIADRCEETHTLLVVDECFVDFLEEPASHTMVPLLGKYKYLMILKAFTKIFAVPGLRIGYGLSSNLELLKNMEVVAQPWRVSVPAQAAGIAACEELAFAEEGRIYCQTQRRLLLEAMHDIGICTYGSKANYIFFKGPADLKERMLDEGFLIRSCSNYEGLDEGFFRIAVCKEEDNRRFLEALKRVLQEE